MTGIFAPPSMPSRARKYDGCRTICRRPGAWGINAIYGNRARCHRLGSVQLRRATTTRCMKYWAVLHGRRSAAHSRSSSRPACTQTSQVGYRI